jgi:starch-binding outer membrane protein, SusD/RagB family
LTTFTTHFSKSPSALGVPCMTVAIHDLPLIAQHEAVGRTTVADDYAQLLADLNEAEGLLPLTRKVARVGIGAVIGLKTRAMLHMGNCQGVKDEYTKLSRTYFLTNSTLTPFSTTNSTENIFSFVHTPESNAGINVSLFLCMVIQPEAPVVW